MHLSQPSHVAHWIGAIGELLNFIGALILAGDLLFRQKRDSEAKLLGPLGDWGRKHGLTATYRNVEISDLDFAAKVQNRWSRRLGLLGIGVMALGFLSLVGYHLVSIYF